MTSSPSPQTAAVDVFVAIVRADGQVLFGLRGPDVYAAHMFNLCSGKLDRGEDPVSAGVREAFEETGLRLKPADLEPCGVVHFQPGGRGPRAGFVFTVGYDPDRHGPVDNPEPAKCLGWQFAPLQTPPQPLEPYNAAVVELLRTGKPIMTVRTGGREHQMRLRPDLLEAVRRGAKTVEVRLADAKRCHVQPADAITFTDPADATDPATVRVAAVRHYRSVDNLVDSEDPAAIAGYRATRPEVRDQLTGIYGDRLAGTPVVAFQLAHDDPDVTLP